MNAFGLRLGRRLGLRKRLADGGVTYCKHGQIY
jgi:hypothetical protein